MSFQNRLMKIRLPIMLPTGSLPGSIPTLELLCVALTGSRAALLPNASSQMCTEYAGVSSCAIFLPYVEI